MVIAWPPQAWRAVAAKRHYLPANVPLVKRAAAVPGDEICALGMRIFIEGRPVATRRTRDPSGRALPWWHGCRRLADGEYLLLMDAPGSFDGRYLGVSKAEQLVGKARLLWRR